MRHVTLTHTSCYTSFICHYKWSVVQHATFICHYEWSIIRHPSFICHNEWSFIRVICHECMPHKACHIHLSRTHATYICHFSNDTRQIVAMWHMNEAFVWVSNDSSMCCMSHTLIFEYVTHTHMSHIQKSFDTPIWPNTAPLLGVGVFRMIRFSTFCTKTHFPESQQNWPKALWELVTWFRFRIPQSIPNVRARWVAKTAARFYHSKFEKIHPWLRYDFEPFLA